MSQVELQFLGVNSKLLDYPTDSFKIVSAGKYVGSCSIADAIRTSDYYAKVADDIAPIGDRDSWFSYIRIEDEFIGQGLGMATYRAAIDQAHGRGMRFRTDPECVSPSAMRVWSKLIRQGQAEELFTFEADSWGDYTGGLIISLPDRINAHTKPLFAGSSASM